MYTKESLKEALEKMGLKSEDAIMVHSSMKSIGEVEGGTDTVVDAFMEYFSEGLLMTPTHTWAQMSMEHNVFDPANEPSCVGIITNIFRQRAGVLRSLHPTHSIAAYGKGAASYIKGEENCKTPCEPGGCWDRLKDINAKILLVGVTHIRNTFIHAVEENFNVPERFTAEPWAFSVVMPDGSLRETPMYRHYNPKTAHISESYDKLMDALYETGAARQGVFGDAECILCDAAKTYEVVGRILIKEPNCLIDRETIPREWWQ